MPELRFNTSADLKGFHDLDAALERFHAKVKVVSADMQKMGALQGAESASGGIAMGGGGGLQYGPRQQGGPASGGHAQPQGPARRPRGGSKPQYDLSTQGGVIEYYDNVLAQALPMLSAMNPAGAPRSSIGASHRQPAGGLQNVSGMVPLLGNNFKSRHMAGSTPYYEDYFNRIGQADVQSMMSPSLRQSYLEAQGLYIGGRKNTAAEFYQNYASEANQPPIISQRTSFLGHFANSARGTGLKNILSSGLKGGIMGSLAGGALGGGALGGAAGDAVGLLMGGLPGLLGATAMSWAGSQVSQGYSQWQQTAPGVSALAHSLNQVGTAGKSVEQFRVQVGFAGANVAMNLAQAGQAAALLTQSFSKLSESGIVKLVQQTGAAALHFGLSPTQMTQLTTSAATMGITSGVGSLLTSGGYDQMLSNMVGASGMQGRQGPLFTGLTSIYGTLASINPTISNPTGVAGQYAAMNASGIQGLQGMRGAALVSQMDQGFASAKGIQQLLGFSAIMKASGGKITNPYQMMSIMEQGSAAKIGNTTLGAAYLSRIKGITSDPYLQAALFGMGGNINQNLALIQSGMFNAGPMSTAGKMYTPASTADRLKMAQSVYSVEQSRAGYIAALGVSKGLGLFAKTPTMIDGNGNPIVNVGPSGLLGQYTGSSALSSNTTNPANAVLDSTFAALGSPGQNNPVNILGAIMQVESSGNPYALNNNTTGARRYPKTLAAYLALDKKWRAAGDSVDQGAFQINSRWHPNVTPAQAANFQYASKFAANLLLSDYTQSSKYTANGKQSWSTAIEAYNGGLGQAGTNANQTTLGYLTNVRTAEADMVPNAVVGQGVTLTPATVKAIGSAVASALRQLGIGNGSRR